MEEANEDESENFKVYMKFHIVQSTAKQDLPSPLASSSSTSSSGIGSNQTGGGMHSKSRTSTTSANMFIQHSADNIDSNKFFVYGLFFLNTGDVASNRLVFFLFNCVPEHIKLSLIQPQANTYLVRKPLFAHSVPPTTQSKVEFTRSNSSNEPYKFYFSRNARKSSTMGSSLSSKNLIKKCFSISEILARNELFGANFSNNPNDTYLLYCLNRIEERCAKFYIKSLIHYLGNIVYIQ